MSQEQFANRAVSALAALMGTSDTTLSVAAPAVFPTAPQFRILVDSELMLVTGVAGAVFTVTRGIEGTTAATHAQGATVTHIITAGGIASALQPIGLATFGTGVDGVAAFDGLATFAFASLVGSTYTLTRDIFLADGSSIATGITIATAGFRFFCNGTLTNSGTIQNNGKDAVNGTAGAAQSGGTLGIGLAGGNGHTGVGAGSNGSSVPTSNALQDASAAGGAGGAGGAQAGGNGGTYSGAAINGGANHLTPIITGFLFNSSSGGNQATIAIIGGGAGGGGGGSDNAGVTGGGGGGGAGVLILAAYSLVNNGTIRAKGGAGAAASGVGGNGGGGGGGAGGIIQLVHRYHVVEGTIDASGGVGGAAVGTGVAGSAGSAGHINHAYA